MRFLWTLLKTALALVLIIPVAIIVLATTLGLFGALFGLAVLALRVAIAGLVVWGAFSLISRLFRGRTPSEPSRPAEVKALPPVDRHYEAAMRELDRELGHTR